MIFKASQWATQWEDVARMTNYRVSRCPVNEGNSEWCQITKVE